MKKTILIVPILILAGCATAQGNSNGQSRIVERFQQADANGDGMISREEAPSRIDFDAADTDGDGMLSFSEVERFTQSLRG